MRLIANIKGTDLYDQVSSWLNSIEFSKLLKSSYAPLRQEQWFLKGSNLKNLAAGKAEIIDHSAPPDFISSLGKKHFAAFNSILVCKGVKPESDTTIDWHRDHGHFEALATMFNIGRAEYSEKLYTGEVIVKALEDGDIVEIDTKLVHRSIQISESRYNVTFRKVKTEHSIHKLF